VFGCIAPTPLIEADPQAIEVWAGRCALVLAVRLPRVEKHWVVLQPISNELFEAPPVRKVRGGVKGTETRIRPVSRSFCEFARPAHPRRPRWGIGTCSSGKTPVS
jgi:hypothetical protein